MAADLCYRMRRGYTKTRVIFFNAPSAAHWGRPVGHSSCRRRLHFTLFALLFLALVAFFMAAYVFENSFSSQRTGKLYVASLPSPPPAVVVFTSLSSSVPERASAHTYTRARARTHRVSQTHTHTHTHTHTVSQTQSLKHLSLIHI